MKAFISVLVLGVTLCAVVIRADDDALRDLGTSAAPGEIPKWDGTQWRNAHDNITTVNAGAGLSGTMTNGEITLSVVFNTNGTSNVVARVDHVHADLEATRPPVGAVVAWLKSLPNTPTNLPSGWTECSGQVLNDTNSVYNTQTIPNLNGVSGTKRFLRGAPSSGATGGSETHHHTVPSKYNGMAGYTGGAEGNTSDESTLPSYYEVVWIMRIK